MWTTCDQRKVGFSQEMLKDITRHSQQKLGILTIKMYPRDIADTLLEAT